jgi:O-antigen/teichoic acid export membrane protein
MIDKFKSLKAHNGFKRYFKNTSWLFGEKILRMIAALFIGVWVARYLGPEKFGLLSYAQSFVALFAVVASLGLDSLVVRELVKDESRAETLLGTSFFLKIFGAFSMLIFLGIALHVTSNDFYTKVLIFIIASALIFQSFNVVDFYFQSKVMSKYIVYANVISLLFSSIAKITLILSNAGLEAFVWVVLFDSIVLALGYLYYFFRNSDFKIRKLIFSKSTAILLLKDSWPLILTGFVISIYMKIDQVMIKQLLGDEAVGQYSAAVRISEAWYFIPGVIASSLFPAIINAKNHSEELYYKRIQRLYDLMVWIGIAIAVPVTFLSDNIINLLYGGQYNQAGGVLLIHIWAGVFVFLGISSGKWYLTENLQKLLFWRSFYGMLVNIGLNIILIPSYGIKGAALATLFSQIVAAYIFDISSDKTRLMFIMKTRSIFLTNSFNKKIFNG